LPPGRNYVYTQSWDTSVKEGKDHSFVVGQVWAKNEANNYLVYQYRKQVGFTETVRAMRMVKQMFPQTNKILIEDKANGPAIIQTLKNEIGGIIPIEPKGSKEARLENCSFIIESGNVYLPTPNKIENAWIKDYIYEMTAFPLGEFDDQVDSTSQYLNHENDSVIDKYRKLCGGIL
jgi:predicted phage terminase large subunit-like protein